MVRKINLNGKLLDEDKVGLSVQNRAFKYGDCFFETIRMINGKPLFLEDHFSRLTRGMKTLHYEIPPHWDLAFLKKEIAKLTEANSIERGGRVRLSVFRTGKGYYTPESNEFGFTIEAYDGESNQFNLNESGLKIGIYDDVRIHPDKFSPFKTNNSLVYIDAGISRSKSEFDEVLLLNDKGYLVEAVSSNLFLHIDGILYTPSLNEGPIAGIMRKKIIQIAKRMGVAVIETSISVDVLEKADEVFICNSINGIKWVSGYAKKRYFHRLSEKLITELNKISV